MATHSGTLAWKIPWTEEPGGQRPWGCKELDTQRSLMATVHGAAESDTTEPLHFLSFCGAGSSLVAQLVKSLPAMWEIRVQPLGWEDSPGEGNGNPLQYFCLENSTNREA